MDVTFAHDSYVAYDFYGKFAQIMVILVGKSLRRSHNDRFAGVDSERIEILHVADGYTVVETVTDNFIFYLFPALERFLYQHLRREGECFFRQFPQFLRVVAESAAEAAESISRPDNDGIAERFSRFESFLDGGDGMAFYGLDIYLVKFFNEKFAVFRVHDCLNGRSEHFHVIFLKHSRAIQLHSAVEGGLATEGEQNSVRPLTIDHSFHELWRYRKKIYFVGNSFRCLDCGNVGVYEDGFDSLLFHSFQSLRAAVVEFAGLTYFQCAASEKKHFFYCLIVGGHACCF